MTTFSYFTILKKMDNNSIAVSDNFRKKINLLALAIILAIIPITIAISQQKQNLVQRASGQKESWKSYEQALSENKINAPYKILEINLKYDQNLPTQIDFDKVVKKQGFAPTYIEKSGYKLQILNRENAVLSEVFFKIPNQPLNPPPLKGESTDARPNALNKVDFTLTVPFREEFFQLRIFNPSNMVVASKSLAGLEEKYQTPNFNSIRGDEFIEAERKGLLNFLPLFSKKTFAATNDNQYLDITFISSNYKAWNLYAFHQDVNRFISYLLTYEPFKSRASQIRFNYVDNTSDLGCEYAGRTILCNISLIMQAVNNSGVPYDTIGVIENNSNYGGSATTNIAVAYNGTDYGPQVFVHEFGHSLGRLWDEYNTQTDPGPLDNIVRMNCYGGSPPANDANWQVVLPADYTLGCSWPNWYRSSQDSIMLNITTPYFNKLSQNYLGQTLNAYTFAVPSPTPTPSPTITTTPIPSPTLTPTPTPSPSSTPSPTIAEKYIISGLVFIDSNKNGVKNAGELLYGGKFTVTSTAGSVSYPSAGNFKISNLSSGTYTITFTVPQGFKGSYPTPSSGKQSYKTALPCNSASLNPQSKNTNPPCLGNNILGADFGIYRNW